MLFFLLEALPKALLLPLRAIWAGGVPRWRRLLEGGPRCGGAWREMERPVVLGERSRRAIRYCLLYLDSLSSCALQGEMRRRVGGPLAALRNARESSSTL